MELATIEIFNIRRTLVTKELLMALMNIYIAGYTEVLITGEFKNLLAVEVWCFWRLFTKELKVFLQVDNINKVAPALLSSNISGLLIKENLETEVLLYLKGTYPHLLIKECHG